MRVQINLVQKTVHLRSFVRTVKGARMIKLQISVVVTVILLLASACTSSSLKEQSRAEASVDLLTVEGVITVRGNEPFTAVILQTENRNSYILKMSPEMRLRLITPAYRRVTGRMYLDKWNGRDFVHLEVYRMETVQ